MEPTQPSPDEQLAQSAWVRRLAQSMLRDPALADDAAQLGSIAAWQHGPIDSHARASWLATTVRRLAGRLARGEARRTAREHSAARGEALPSAAELVERAEAHRALVAAVLALEEPYRSTVLLRYVEDLPPRAIARRAGVPVATVKTRLARGLERLRKELERDCGDAREWLGLLVPFTHPLPAPAILGVSTLVKSIKFTVAALVVLCLGAGLLWVTNSRTALEPPPGVPEVSLGLGDGSPPKPPASESSRTVPTGLAEESASRSSVSSDVRAALEKLRGRVLDPQDQPIAGASVSVLHSASGGYEVFDRRLREELKTIAFAKSDSTGAFEFELLRGTIVDLLVTADGFADEQLVGKIPGSELLIRLAPWAGLVGYVTRIGDGTPVVDAIVLADCGEGGEIMRRAGTDSLGRYSFDDITPGRVGLIVAPKGDGLTSWEELEVRPGETLRRDYHVGAGNRVSGRLIDAETGAPIAGAWVSAFDFTYKTCGSNALGEFELAGLGQRQVTLAVQAPGYGRLDQRVLEFGAPVELVLHRGRRAHGRILGPGGEPVPDAFVAALGSGASEKEVRTARSDSRGEFELVDLTANQGHVLLVRAEAYGSSFRSFPSDQAGAGRLELGDVRLDGAAFLEGRVLDDSGKPCVGIAVTLKPSYADPVLQAKARLHGNLELETDSRGSFAFRDVGPGDWLLGAQGTGLMSPEDRRLHLSGGDVRRDLELRLGTGICIEGLVRDADGHPIQEAWVSVQSEGAELGHEARHTDADGHFSVSGLRAGNFTVVVTGPSSELDTEGRFEPLALRNVPAGGVPLDLRLLARSSAIRGRVVDAKGVPLAGAFVWRMGESSPPREFVLTDSTGRFEISVPTGASVRLLARGGMPLAQSERGPTVRELRAGRVLLADSEPTAASGAVDAGTDDLELRLPQAQ